MPKYKKGRERALEKLKQEKQQLIELKKRIYKSSIRSIFLGLICFIISLLLNGELLPIEVIEGSTLDIALIITKILSIVLFFSFVFLGLANSMELKGKPATIREIIIIAIISLIQSVRSGLIFGISLVGILIIVFYIWLVQTKVKTI
ncbi:MAG: hypothetical protein ACTSO9_00035 [Candidatus Helarchaeota archaeon]